MQVNMTNRILQVSSIARQQLRILLFAIFNAWAIGYARRLTMFHLVPAEVKASGPIRTSLYEREGSIRPLEATFTEALQAPCLKPPNHPLEASKRTVWRLQTPQMGFPHEVTHHHGHLHVIARADHTDGIILNPYLVLSHQLRNRQQFAANPPGYIQAIACG